MIVENKDGWQAIVSFDEEQDLLGLVAELDHVAMNNPDRPFLSSLRRQLYLVFEAELHALPEESTEPSEPDEEDGIIQFLRDRYSVSLSAAHLGDYETDHEARYWLQLEMDKTGFSPNAWTISDHGNAHLITLDKAVPLTTTDANPQPITAAELHEQLPSGTNVTVTYKHYEESGGRPTHETVSGFVDWEYVAIADGLDDDERDSTIAVIADNGRGGPRYVIALDLLQAVTIAQPTVG